MKKEFNKTTTSYSRLEKDLLIQQVEELTKRINKIETPRNRIMNNKLEELPDPKKTYFLL